MGRRSNNSHRNDGKEDDSENKPHGSDATTSTTMSAQNIVLFP